MVKVGLEPTQTHVRSVVLYPLSYMTKMVSVVLACQLSLKARLQLRYQKLPAGVEPATFRLQGGRSATLSYKSIGCPRRTRTFNQHINSVPLYH